MIALNDVYLFVGLPLMIEGLLQACGVVEFVEVPVTNIVIN